LNPDIRIWDHMLIGFLVATIFLKNNHGTFWLNVGRSHLENPGKFLLMSLTAQSRREPRESSNLALTFVRSVWTGERLTSQYKCRAIKILSSKGDFIK
jgi:hypothetical protein